MGSWASNMLVVTPRWSEASSPVEAAASGFRNHLDRQNTGKENSRDSRCTAGVACVHRRLSGAVGQAELAVCMFDCLEGRSGYDRFARALDVGPAVVSAAIGHRFARRARCGSTGLGCARIRATAQHAIQRFAASRSSQQDRCKQYGK